ncbi:unnamed protein product [Protopolystoma xenopodis]|uniref:Uncharacterized protein n=1 Tax=Protopolystoma xenopodis TaxID=117903 RepID=A0A3S5AV61_9PLAT|nr:unnamed protein product [Protopolystoma xenopodis]
MHIILFSSVKITSPDPNGLIPSSSLETNEVGRLHVPIYQQAKKRRESLARQQGLNMGPSFDCNEELTDLPAWRQVPWKEPNQDPHFHEQDDMESERKGSRTIQHKQHKHLAPIHVSVMHHSYAYSPHHHHHHHQPSSHLQQHSSYRHHHQYADAKQQQNAKHTGQQLLAAHPQAQTDTASGGPGSPSSFQQRHIHYERPVSRKISSLGQPEIGPNPVEEGDVRKKITKITY